jgi:hypothetical protein
MIELRGQVVHTYPCGDFDIEAVEQGMTTIIKTAAGLDNWAIFEHTAADAGLTTSSIKFLLQYYEKAAEYGCVGVAIGGNSLFMNIIPHHIPAEMNLPVKVSGDDRELQVFLDELLTSPT